MSPDLSITMVAASAPTGGDLLEMRKVIRELGGRADMIDSSGNAISGRQVDWLINQSQKELDMRLEIYKMLSNYFVDVEEGDAYITLTNCRSIKQVWMTSVNSDANDNSAQELDVMEWREFREAYPSMDAAFDSNSTADSSSRPLYYAVAPTAVSADQASGKSAPADLSVSADYYLTQFGNHWQTKTIVFAPPADGDYTMRVLGHFFSPTLTNDSDQSYWTKQHPMLLFLCFMKNLEAMQRNEEGSRVWEGRMDDYLNLVDSDAIDEDSSGPDEYMKG